MNKKSIFKFQHSQFGQADLKSFQSYIFILVDDFIISIYVHFVFLFEQWVPGTGCNDVYCELWME